MLIMHVDTSFTSSNFCSHFHFLYFSQQQEYRTNILLIMADSTKEVIPPGWEKRLSRSTGNTMNVHSYLHSIKTAPNNSGIHYYLNLHTKESQWDCPTESAEPLSSVPDKVQASHLLVKHSKSRRPSSWREENITRSKDEARKILQGYHERVSHSHHFGFWDFWGTTIFFYRFISHSQILSGEATLAQLAQKYSDCSSAKRGGDLGPFGRGAMQKPFEDATFALNVGELSDIIETDSGLHLIERTQ